MRALFRACLSGCSKQCCFEEGRPENEPFATDGPSVSLGWSGLASGESEVLDFEKKENDMPVGMRLGPMTISEKGTHDCLTNGLSIYGVSHAHVGHLLEGCQGVAVH